MSRPTTNRTAPSFAALVQSFFTEYLTQQRALSPQTVAAYRDAFVLFLDFAVVSLHKQPTTLSLQDITPGLILDFLAHWSVTAAIASEPAMLGWQRCAHS